MRASVRNRVLTVAALAAAPLMVQYPALADQSSVTVAQSAVPSIAPGTSARVNLAENNTGDTASFSTMTFTAPASAKFADTNLYFNDQPVKYVSCSLSNGDTTMTCSADGALEFPAASQTNVGVDVQVPADTGSTGTLTGGSMYIPSVSSQQVWPFAVSTAQSAPADSNAAVPAAAPAAAPDAAPADAVPQAPGNVALATTTDSGSAVTAAPATGDSAYGDPTAADSGSAMTAAPATGDSVYGDPTAADAAPQTQDPAALGDDSPAPMWVHGTRVYDVRILAGLNIRQGPGTGWPVIGSLPAGATTGVTCKVNGTIIDGNPRWYRLATRPGWISARYAENLNGIPPFCP